MPIHARLFTGFLAEPVACKTALNRQQDSPAWRKPRPRRMSWKLTRRASNPDGFELVFKAAVDKGANSVAAFASPFFNFNRNIGPS